MSKWNLAYKGTEILTPEEWNHVVDALEELDGRAPVERNGGLAVFDGDGVTTMFTITHGLSTTPTVALVGKAISGLPDIDYWEADTTSIKVYFKSAPSSGSENVKLWWYVVRL
ncbi:MAG: hypothetical protein DRP01_02235 [Archaeoglobales archaeon]|nr:MAG: hypothetical protein DRP01_02235 [Archaeoglobales archaeon]